MAELDDSRTYSADEVRGILGLDGKAGPSRIEVRSEPLTYARERRDVSFFRDFLVKDRDPEAAQRQAKHVEEMRVEVPRLAERRQRESDRRAEGLEYEFEYRINPNRTIGQGGEFAPPLWMNALFATAPRVGRVLTDPRIGTPIFATPQFGQSINLPRLTTGNVVAPAADLAPVPGQDILDAAVSSPIVAFVGESDVSIQELEQSPQGASFDWVTWTDLFAAYVQDFETQLLTGSGTGGQFYGLLNVPGINTVTYTDASPTATEMFPFIGQTIAAMGKTRKRQPEAWLATTARHAWLGTSEDQQNRPLGLADYQGSFPIGSLVGYPVFLDDAIPTTLNGNQDALIACKPSDLVVFEGDPRVAIMPEPLSGTLGVRLQMRCYGAAILGRYPTGISVLQGTGMVPASGF